MNDKLAEIQNWKAPKWHEDLGDPAIELQLLKELCRYIITECPDYDVALDCFEEGYMQVHILLDSTNKFDLQVIDTKLPKIGLFGFDGSEHYITSIGEVKHYLK